MLVASAAIIGAIPGSAQAEDGTVSRSEVAVREVTLSDGTRRYAVPVRVGQTDIIAGLDSGSTGLRILPGALKQTDADPTSAKDSYAYGAGTKLMGVAARAHVQIGDLAKDTTVQLVEHVGCSEQKPHCPASALPIARFGIQGDGLPGEGFKAILGVNMGKAEVASTFEGIGARRWIIDLPRPGEPNSGRIVLNPRDDETKGFVNLPLIPQLSDQNGAFHDAVAGCLVNAATHERLCGAIDLDTGAPGIQVISTNGTGRPWPDNTPAMLLFGNTGGHVKAAESIIIGRRDHASHLTFQTRDRAPMMEIMSGLTAYFAYSILYDPVHCTVGLKPRPVLAQGPRPIAAD